MSANASEVKDALRLLALNENCQENEYAAWRLQQLFKNEQWDCHFSLIFQKND
jgi:hypothetical protein